MWRLLICLLFIGCAIPNSYRQNCTDISSSAAHSYEHLVGQPSVVCVGKISPRSKDLHAQAMGVYGEWLTVLDRILYVGVSKELGENLIYWCEPVVEFDKRYGRTRK